MSYLFEEPFVVDRSAMARELGATATPAEKALAETRATYQAVAGRVPGRAR